MDDPTTDMDQLTAIQQSLELNCSKHDLFYTPPNVSTHFNGTFLIA